MATANIKFTKDGEGFHLQVEEHLVYGKRIEWMGDGFTYVGEVDAPVEDEEGNFTSASE
tara:strand:- start:572 stop:748 length:177 start_codon:yes stop_codon:yes gene_type:complete